MEFAFDGGSRIGWNPLDHAQLRDLEQRVVRLEQDVNRRLAELEDLVPAPESPAPEDSDSRPAWSPSPGDTVWLELSREGPFKVIGPYHNPRGTEIQARRPGDAPNVHVVAYVEDGLWLCQDRRKKIHILPAGSLTPHEPTGTLGHAVAWCWERREAALWVAAVFGLLKAAL